MASLCKVLQITTLTSFCGVNVEKCHAHPGSSSTSSVTICVTKRQYAYTIIKHYLRDINLAFMHNKPKGNDVPFYNIFFLIFQNQQILMQIRISAQYCSDKWLPLYMKWQSKVTNSGKYGGFSRTSQRCCTCFCQVCKEMLIWDIKTS